MYGEPRVIRGNGNRLSETSQEVYEIVYEPGDLSLALVTRVDSEDLFMSDVVNRIDDVMADEGRDDWSIPIIFPDGTTPVSIGFFGTRAAAREALPLVNHIFGDLFDEGQKTGRPMRIREINELPL
jgi:hypothetical protein